MSPITVASMTDSESPSSPKSENPEASLPGALTHKLPAQLRPRPAGRRTAGLAHLPEERRWYAQVGLVLNLV